MLRPYYYSNVVKSLVMIARIKKKINEKLGFLVDFFIKTNLSPNTFTSLSLFISLTFPIIVALARENSLKILAVSLILLSGFFDFLDGAIARRVGRVSKLGAFLDSTFDRVSDAAYILGLLLAGALDSLEAFIMLVLTYLISYQRARAEAVCPGIKLEGRTLLERAERIILFSIIYILYLIRATFLAQILIYITLFLLLISCFLRFSIIIKELGSSNLNH